MTFYCILILSSLSLTCMCMQSVYVCMYVYVCVLHAWGRLQDDIEWIPLLCTLTDWDSLLLNRKCIALNTLAGQWALWIYLSLLPNAVAIDMHSHAQPFTLVLRIWTRVLKLSEQVKPAEPPSQCHILCFLFVFFWLMRCIISLYGCFYFHFNEMPLCVISHISY